MTCTRSRTRLILALVATTLAASPANARTVGDAEVPETSVVGGVTLMLNGTGLYEATVLQIDIFAAALYLERKTQSAREAARCDGPVEFDFFWLYDPSRDDLAVPWRATMRANAGADLPKLEARIDQMIAVVRDAHEGERWRFLYTPGHGLDMLIQDRLVVSVPGQDFCRLFIGGHVGPSADEAVRRGLLGGH